VTLLLLLAAVAGGTLSTYAYDEESPLPARVAVGAPLGLTLLGLIGFVLASAVGLTAVAVAVSAALVLVLGAIALRRAPGRLRTDVLVARDMLMGRLRHPDRWTVALGVLGAASAALVWRIYERAMIEGPDGAIYTGVDHNLGDLPFHIAVINSFVHGGNFPPEHPELAGVRLTYAFLADFVTAMFMRAGAGLRDAMFVVNVTLALSLVALLFRWASHFTRDRLAAVVAPLLVFLSGGFGFLMLLRDVDPEQGGLVGLLQRLSHDYTILGTGELRWGNLVVTMLMTQRSILMGLPLVVAVWILWWQAGAMDERRRMRSLLAGAGAITGLLPLAHAHAFVVTMAVAVMMAVATRRVADWRSFFIPAVALSVPQVAWLAAGSALETTRFVDFHLGWDRGQQPLSTFWLYNLGLFIPLLVLALYRGTQDGWLSRRHLLFYLPFLAWFVVPNVLKLSPWIWDNIKFLVWWHLASAPIVALLLARWWHKRGGWRLAAAAAFVALTLSGALDVSRVATRSIELAIYSAPAVAFGHRIRAVTPPGSIVLHAPTYNSEVFLAGRRSVLGYPGHTWSQGLDAGTREDDIRVIYAGGPEAGALLARHTPPPPDPRPWRPVALALHRPRRQADGRRGRRPDRSRRAARARPSRPPSARGRGAIHGQPPHPDHRSGADRRGRHPPRERRWWKACGDGGHRRRAARARVTGEGAAGCDGPQHVLPLS
jgi:hypothetical protein